ncbi:MAG: hypothetical protein IIY01_03350, partial [Clostridia bacterium]|nr:hypothetical protein [Clostridia bacterium]
MPAGVRGFVSFHIAAKGRNISQCQRHYFTFCRKAKYFTKDQKFRVSLQIRKKLFHIRRKANISLE